MQSITGPIIRSEGSIPTGSITFCNSSGNMTAAHSPDTGAGLTHVLRSNSAVSCLISDIYYKGTAIYTNVHSSLLTLSSSCWISSETQVSQHFIQYSYSRTVQPTSDTAGGHQKDSQSVTQGGKRNSRPSELCSVRRCFGLENSGPGSTLAQAGKPE